MASKFEISYSSLAILLLALLMGAAAAQEEESANTKFVSASCNTKKIPRGSPFYDNLRDMLEDIKQNTAYNGYDYESQREGSEGAPTAYGRAICKQSASQSDCTSCLSNVSDRIYGICNNAIGARVQLSDCYLRYEQHKF